ncbi:hypothetical protein DdX_13170 [Ditylenchus destructor]|uniref:Uncharacterized protein n=1 Tax=Ditylenchus destructor TaxID=166010 RepID=A0AAD4QZQ8_9BILA|nr:hypothetical protein DdX_13170 [Ditylenchus destructor]
MNRLFPKTAINSSVFFLFILLDVSSAGKDSIDIQTVGSSKTQISNAAKSDPKSYVEDGMENVRKVIGLSESHRYQDSLQTLLKEPGKVDTFQHVVIVLTGQVLSLRREKDQCSNFTGTHCKEFKKIILDVFNNIGDRNNKLPRRRGSLQILAWMLRIFEASPSERNLTDVLQWMHHIRNYTDADVLAYTVVQPDTDETLALHEQLIETLGGHEEDYVNTALIKVKHEMTRHPEEIQKITPDIVLDIVKAFSLKQDTIDGAQHTRVSIDWNQLKQAAGDFFYNKMRVGLENSRVFEKFWENEGDFVTIEIKSIASRAYYFLWEMYWTVFYKITEEFYVNCRIGTLEEALEKRKKEYNKGMAKLAKLTLDCYKRSLGRRTPNPAIKIPLV